MKGFLKISLKFFISFHDIEEAAVDGLNKALQEENRQDFYKTLMDPNLGLNDNIDEFAIPLYYEEMKIDYTESKVTEHLIAKV